MYRIILFLLLVALAAMGAAWVADQPGEVVFPWAGGLAHVTTEITGFGVRYTLDLLRRGWPARTAA